MASSPHPYIPNTDEDRRRMLDAIGAGSGAEKVMQLAWRDAGYLRVDRRPPRLTPLGKVLHLHTDRVAAPPPS